ncbi:hypothetical protein BH11MYX1_BH11MYX1_12910 [soil metagenome]
MLLKLGLIALLAGCPSSDPGACKAPASNGSLEAELVVADNAGNVRVVHDGDPVALHGAPQGGHVLLVGARVHADQACQYDATGSLRDLASNRAIGVEQRALIVMGTGDGWSAPDAQLSSMPNVAVCPNFATGTAVFGQPYELEVALRVGDQTVADLKAMVTPMCAADDMYCQNDCGAHQQ